MHTRSTTTTLASVLAMALLLQGGEATAKPLNQLSDSELVEVLLGSPSVRKRESAAALLGEHRSGIAAEALGRACLDDREGEVCDRALDALLAIGSEDAMQQTAEVLRSSDVESPRRQSALAILLTHDPERVDYFLAEVLSHYRDLSPALAMDLLDCLRTRELTDLGDMAVFIASDELAHRDVRLSALVVSEHLEHPRLFDAFVALASDEDKDVRTRCAEGLGNPAYPGVDVVPTLMQLAQHDAAAPVRVAALSSLRFFAHPGLLSLLHDRLISESNPTAWATALVLLETVANPSSLSIVERLLKGDDRLPQEVVLRLIRIYVRVGTTTDSIVLDSLANRSRNPSIVQAAQQGAQLLEAPDEFRERTVARWKVGAGVFLWNPQGPQVEVLPLGVSLDEEGVLVRSETP